MSSESWTCCHLCRAVAAAAAVVRVSGQVLGTRLVAAHAVPARRLLFPLKDNSNMTSRVTANAKEGATNVAVKVKSNRISPKGVL